MTTVFRIYTESSSDYDANVYRILDQSQFSGYTAFHADGAWKGKHEATLVLEIVTDDDEAPRIRLIADIIRETNRQQTVMVTQSSAVVDFI